MSAGTVVVETLDVAAFFLLLPGVAGSARLETAWKTVSSGFQRPAAKLLSMAGRCAMATLALLVLWLIAGWFAIGDILDKILYEAFDANTLAKRFLVIGGTIGVLMLPAVVGGLLWVLGHLVGAALSGLAWIARRRSLTYMITAFAIVLFLAARTMTIMGAS
jgi:hypothetical protein